MLTPMPILLETITYSQWASSLVYGLPVDIFVAVFVVYWTTKEHKWLRKKGIVDGTKVTIETIRAGISILKIEMIGNSVFDAVKDGVAGVLGLAKKSEPTLPTSTLKETLKQTAKEGISSVMAEQMTEIFKEPEFRKDLQKQLKDVTKNVITSTLKDELGVDAKMSKGRQKRMK